MMRSRWIFVGMWVELVILGLGAPGCTDAAAPPPVEETTAALIKGGVNTPVRHGFIGAFDPSTAHWYIHMQRPGWSTDTATDTSFFFGNSGDTPLVGDWNGDGVETHGVFRAGWWFLSNTLGHGTSDLSFAWANSTDVPIVGDWNGDGVATPGVFRSGTFFLHSSNSTAGSDVSFSFGMAGDIPLAGDWNGDGIDSVGVYRPSTSTFLLTNGTTGHIDVTLAYGDGGDVPIVGDWDGDGQTTVGVVQGGTSFALTNSLSSGFGDVYVTYAPTSSFKPISGTWTANAPTNNAPAPASLATFFPLGVEQQNSSTFASWKSFGINTAVIVPSGGASNHEDVATWTTDAFNLGLKAIRDVTLGANGQWNPGADNGLLAWGAIDDEPDDNGSYPTNGTAPSALVSKYNTLHTANASRPAFLNFAGKAVLDNDRCNGFGDPSGTATSCYAGYLPLSDWLSNDFYPVNWLQSNNQDYGIDAVARAADKLRRWSAKPQHVFIEASAGIYSQSAAGPTPAQLSAEVWLAIVHGARAITYFVHGHRASDNAWLTDNTTSTIRAAMTTVNQNVSGLAAILQTAINPPSLGFSVVGPVTAPATLDAGWRLSSNGAHSLLIVVNKGTATVTQTMRFSGLPTGTTFLTVYGEGNRTVSVSNNQFTDTFAPYAVHIYSN
ncbi:MAG TPA: hypothetical protein VHL80_09610 [Polyangia bacterium]|nr:hypothetical protein [Polyangia bacterium]